MERYNRQIILENFGLEKQQLLLEAKVLVIGAGGLGCPVLQYLVAAGVGTIGIMDNDTVSLSNLQRQVIYDMQDIGKPKALVAQQKMQALNNEITIVAYNEMLDNANTLKYFPLYDVIVDCTDNFATRYRINDACVLLQKPLIYAAIYQFEGQVAIFNVADAENNCSNYRDLFPEPPTAEQAPSCNTAGVIGVLPGIIGTLQALEVIKHITQIGKLLYNKILNYNTLTHENYIVEIIHSKEGNNKIPITLDDFLKTDYQWLCATKNSKSMNSNLLIEKYLNQENALWIDVREIGEMPLPTFNHIQIPLSTFNSHTLQFAQPVIVVFCQSGGRSQKATEILKNIYGPTKEIFNFEGGINVIESQLK